jgi:protoporphyrinogen oxidase
MAELPEEMVGPCIAAYEGRRAKAADGAGTFRDYLIESFGEYLAEHFLIPQNEKTLATSLDRLSRAAVKRFFPPPNDSAVRAGMQTGRPPSVEYNSRFWYPRQGGIERLVAGLASGIDDIRLLEPVMELDGATRRLRTARGTVCTWEVLFSSMPLARLCRISNDPELRAWGSRLTHSATISINLGLRGEVAPELREAHWIYVPDRRLPFYRVGIYSNLSRGLCPPGLSSMYVEVGLPGDRLDRMDFTGELQSRVIAALESIGWVRTDSIVCSVVHAISCAYVHHTPEREATIGKIFDRLRNYGIHPIGRYGLWDYTSMEDSIYSTIEIVEREI